MFEDRRHLVFAPAAMALSSLMSWLQVHPAVFRDLQDRQKPDEADPVPLRKAATVDS